MADIHREYRPSYKSCACTFIAASDPKSYNQYRENTQKFRGVDVRHIRRSNNVAE